MRVNVNNTGPVGMSGDEAYFENCKKLVGIMQDAFPEHMKNKSKKHWEDRAQRRGVLNIGFFGGGIVGGVGLVQMASTVLGSAALASFTWPAIAVGAAVFAGTCLFCKMHDNIQEKHNQDFKLHNKNMAILDTAYKKYDYGLGNRVNTEEVLNTIDSSLDMFSANGYDIGKKHKDHLDYLKVEQEKFRAASGFAKPNNGSKP